MNATSEYKNDHTYRPFKHGIFRSLEIEWHTLCRDASVNEIAERWAKEEPALEGISTLKSFELARQRPIVQVDAMFGALLRRGAISGKEGELANRIVFQLMLPKAARLTGLHRDLIPEFSERTQLSLTALWTAIKEHPSRITRFHAPHIGWRAHNIMRREALAGSMETPSGMIGGTFEDLNLGEDLADAQGLHPSEELAMVLIWAVAQRVLSKADAELLAARYGSETIDSSKRSWKSVGDVDLDISPAAMRKRCSRATRRLAQAIAEYQSER